LQIEAPQVAEALVEIARQTPLIGSTPVFNPITGQVELEPIYGAPRFVNGFRLVDSRASYGIGLETFALGFPMHFDWSWRTLMNRDWEDVIYASQGGSREFRRVQFALWIGYNF
jgi:hypothetical protein